MEPNKTPNAISFSQFCNLITNNQFAVANNTSSPARGHCSWLHQYELFSSPASSHIIFLVIYRCEFFGDLHYVNFLVIHRYKYLYWHSHQSCICLQIVAVICAVPTAESVATGEVKVMPSLTRLTSTVFGDDQLGYELCSAPQQLLACDNSTVLRHLYLTSPCLIGCPGSRDWVLWLDNAVLWVRGDDEVRVRSDANDWQFPSIAV